MAQFCYFHLMPWTDIKEAQEEWPTSNALFDPVRGKELYDSYIATLAKSEECGFDWVGCNEHHYSPYGLMANCNLVGSILTQKTSDIKLAMLGNLIPLLNPIRVAEEYAMLDVMSGGRLVAGFIRGVPHEYIAYNINPDESRGRMREAISLIIKAWTEPEPFGWEGEYYQYPSVSIWPKPWQKAASENPDVGFERRVRRIRRRLPVDDRTDADRRSQGPRAASIDTWAVKARSTGREVDERDVLAGFNTIIADTDEEAKHLLSEGQRYFHQVLMSSIRSAQRLVVSRSAFFPGDHGANFVKKLASLSVRTIEEQIDAGSVLCGSPESVLKQIKRIKGELGNGWFNLNMKIGNIPDAAVHRSMELFRDRVLPEARAL